MRYCKKYVLHILQTQLVTTKNREYKEIKGKVIHDPGDEWKKETIVSDFINYYIKFFKQVTKLEIELYVLKLTVLANT